MDKLKHSTLANAVLLSERILVAVTCCVTNPNRLCGVMANLMVPVSIAPRQSLRMGLSAVSVLSRRVRHVLLMGSQKKVVRPNTGGIIALMTDLDTDRNRAVVQHPGESVSLNHPLSVIKRAISLSVSLPFPTLSNDSYLSPEALVQCFAVPVTTLIENPFASQFMSGEGRATPTATYRQLLFHKALPHTNDY